MDGHFCGNLKSPQKLPVAPREKNVGSCGRKKINFLRLSPDHRRIFTHVSATDIAGMTLIDRNRNKRGKHSGA